MKKALALVLALVLALSLGVSAFAVTVVDLTKPASASDSEKIELEALENFKDIDGKVWDKYYRAPAEGGTFYFQLNSENKPLKNIEVESSGVVSAKVVKYNPEDMEDVTSWYITKNGVAYSLEEASKKLGDVYGEICAKYEETDEEHFFWIPKEGTELIAAPEPYNGDMVKWMKETPRDLETFFKDVVNYVTAAGSGVWPATDYNFSVVKGLTYGKKFDPATYVSYDFVSEVVAALNKADKTSQYVAEAKDDVYLVEITVEPNYSAAYKTGSFKVTATRVDAQDEATGRVTKSTKVAFKGNVVSDVVIFEYDMVNYCGAKGVALKAGVDKGYSDYEVDGVYGGKNYTVDQLRRWDKATVISTTAFRALRESVKSGISVEAGNMTVSISEIGAGQKGVNFAYDEGNTSNRRAVNGIVKVYNADLYKKYGPIAPEAVEFGFLGNQAIASDFEIEVALGMTAYELREFFGEKVEEEDVITYYILKDGKEFDSFTVDYMSDDVDEKIILTVKGKAGETLGHYSIVLEAPAAPEAPAEENPNTGAESVIGVVAAMAVVSVAAAAAVSLKK